MKLALLIGLIFSNYYVIQRINSKSKSSQDIAQSNQDNALSNQNNPHSEHRNENENLDNPPPKFKPTSANSEMLEKESTTRHKIEFPLQQSNLHNYPIASNHSTQPMLEELRSHTQDILRTLLKSFTTALLLDLPKHENKGDSAITVGELNHLASLNITLLRYFSGSTQIPAFKAARLQMRNSTQKPVILAQGGGNIGTWESCDEMRIRALKTFP